MISYASSVTIDGSPDAVFQYFVEPAKQALWSDVPMRPLTEGPPREGSRLEVTFGMGPIKARIGLQITALDPGKRMTFRTFSGPIRWDGEYRLTPAGAGTQVSQEGRLQF